MKKGKVSEPVLKRSILKYINSKSEDIIIGAGISQDGCVFKISENEFGVVTGNPMFLKEESFVALSFYSVINNIAARGGKPIGININLMLPELFEEIDLKKIIKAYDLLCKEYNIQIMGGHTEITQGVKIPLAVITAVGRTCGKTIPDIKNIKPGQDIVMSKYSGLEGTYLSYIQNRELLKTRFSHSYLMKYEGIIKELTILKEAQIALEHGVSAMHDIREGGILKGLWELGSGSGLGVSVNYKDIPIKQETIELTEILELNPYKILSGGTLIMITEDGKGLVDKLQNNSINAVLIGNVTKSKERVLITQGTKRYLESN